MSDLGTIQNRIVSRDRKITRQSNSYNQFLTKVQCVKQAYSTPLKILKIQDFTSLQNALLVDVFEEKIPSPYDLFQKIKHSTFAC